MKKIDLKQTEINGGTKIKNWGNFWTGFGCGFALTTLVIPNPVSIIGATVSCGSLYF